MPLVRALERVGGLQTQYAPSGYVALWSRLRDFERDALTRALQRGRALQGTLMRQTIHTVSARDYPLFVAGIRQTRRRWWQKTHGKVAPGIDMERVVELVRKELDDGPRRQSEVTLVLKAEGIPLPQAWYGAGLWLDLVRVPPSGTWERPRADIYDLAEHWLDLPAITEEDGIRHLVRRYLGGFGPAPAGDIANWAGLPVTAVREALARMSLRSFRNEVGAELVDLPRARIPEPDTPAPPRFIPTWDAMLLAHARRTEVLPEDYRPLVFNTRTPHSLSTFTVDGRVAGSWTYAKGRVKLQPFAPMPRTARRELEDEAAGLAAFHA